MKSLAAPMSAVVATLSVMAYLMGQKGYTSGWSQGSVFAYLFSVWTLEPDTGIEALLGSIVVWMLVFSVVWLALSLLGPALERFLTRP